LVKKNHFRLLEHSKCCLRHTASPGGAFEKSAIDLTTLHFSLELNKFFNSSRKSNVFFNLSNVKNSSMSVEQNDLTLNAIAF
jgi:hypothetical protein